MKANTNLDGGEEESTEQTGGWLLEAENGETRAIKRANAWATGIDMKSAEEMTGITMSEGVREVLTDDGREVLYSVDGRPTDSGDTDEWIASDVTISGSEIE